MTIKTIHIDEHKCVGAGQCVLAAPEVFDQREEDGVVVLLKHDTTDADAPAIRRAAKLCPAHAIRIEEA